MLKTRLLGVALGAVVLVLGTTALARDDVPLAGERPAERAEESGQLYVELGPDVLVSNVEVTVDGRALEIVSGVPIELSHGPHRVRVAHGGTVFSETIEIGAEPRSIRVEKVAAAPTGTMRIHAGVRTKDLTVRLDGEIVDHEKPIERAHGRYTLTVQRDGRIFTREVEIGEETLHVDVEQKATEPAEPPEVGDLLLAEDPPEEKEPTRREKAKAQAKKGVILLTGGVATAGLGVLGVWLAAEALEDGNSDAPKALVGSAALTVVGAGSAVWGAGLLITSPVRLVTGRQSYVSPHIGPGSVGVHGVF
jgi:hypothetical protein